MRVTERLKPNDRFGKWTIVKQVQGRPDSKGFINHFYEVKCDCGTTGREVSEKALKNGKSNSCGCNKSKNENHKTIRPEVGMKFGRLTVKSKAPDRIRSNGYPRHYFVCECDCGTVKQIEQHKLTSGHTVSCGCIRFKEVKDPTSVELIKNHKHYRRAQNLMRRCNDPSNKDYRNYGGRGIRCDLGSSIIEVAIALEKVPGYFEGAEIDRIDVNGHYTTHDSRFGNEVYHFFDRNLDRTCDCVGNLRWVTHRENALNRRNNK